MKRYQTYVKINLDNLSKNFENIEAKILGKKVIPVVKADAYGHGANEVAKQLVNNGAKLFAVSSLYEAKMLRQSIDESEILVLGYIPFNQINKIKKYNIIPCIYDMTFAKELNKYASKENIKIKVHIKINTGMNRLGFSGFKTIISSVKEIYNMSNLEVKGIFSHFATSDSVDKSFADEQLALFEKVLDALKKENINIEMKHIANSAAITDLEYTYFDSVRAGLVLYGIYPSSLKSEDEKLYKPVMSFHTTVSNILNIKKGDSVSYSRTYTAKEDEKIAVLCVGYADGYNRKFSNKAKVYIKDKGYFDVIGNVCMDMTMIKIPKGVNINIGEEVELFGENVLLSDLALIADTIPYELLCSINKRVKRVY